MEKEDWERAGGVICPKCKQETFRIFEGVCLKCLHAKEDKYWRDAEKHTKFLKFRKAHNARIDKHKQRES